MSFLNKSRHFIVVQAILLQKFGFIEAYNLAPIPLFSSVNDSFSAMKDVCRLKLVKPVFWSSKYCEIFVIYFSVICTLLSEVE